MAFTYPIHLCVLKRGKNERMQRAVKVGMNAGLIILILL
jgi:hypothetical protein